MKPPRSNQGRHALTRVEVLVVIVILAVLAAMLLSALAAAKRKHSRLGCVNNVKQINLSFRIWGGDNGDKYPMQVSETNGGAQTFAFSGDVTAIFRCMSNEIGSAKILHCPDDSSRIAATNFTDLKGKISYFVNVEASDAYPQMILSGDDNFAIGGVPVKSGLLEVSAKTPIAWTAARHKFAGNLGLADGSIQLVSNAGLSKMVNQATNRLAIP